MSDIQAQVTQLSSWKKIIADADERLARNKGKREAKKEELQSNFKVTTYKQAVALLKKMREDEKQLCADIVEKVESISAEMEEEA